MLGKGKILLFNKKNSFDEVEATSNTLQYDFKSEEIKLFGNVFIQESGKNRKKFGSGSTISCDAAVQKSKTDVLSCKGNSKYKNNKKKEKMSSDILIYNKKKQEIKAKGNVVFEKEEEKTFIKTQSDFMNFNKKEKILLLEGSALYSEYDKKEKKLLREIRCDKAKIISEEKDKKSGKIINCWENVALYQPKDKTTIKGQHLFYKELEKSGFIEGRPIITMEKENFIDIFSDRLEMDDNLKKIDLIGKVLIEEREKESGEILSTMNCEKGKYLYTGNPAVNEESGDFFQCHENVVLKKEKDNITIFADTMDHYTNKQLSKLRGNLKFVKIEKDKKKKEGTAGELDLDGKNNNLFFRKGFMIDAYEKNVKEGFFSGKKGNYYYKENEKNLKAEGDIKVINLKDNYRVWSDFVHYDAEKKITTFTGNPLLEKDEKENKKKIAYGEILSINENQEKAFFKKNVVVSEVDQNMVLSRSPEWILDKKNKESFLKCENGTYFFKKEINRMQCEQDVLVEVPKNHQKMTSDKIVIELDDKIYKAEGNVVIMEDDPKKHFLYRINADVVTMNDIAKITTFEEDIEIRKNTRQQKTVQKIECKKGIYNFLDKKNRNLTCEQDVVVNDYEDKYKITGKLLVHYLDKKYSTVSGNPIFLSKNNNKVTKVTADIFNYFKEEDLLYMKGNVKIINDKYNIHSLFGNYDLKKKEMYLFEKTEIENKDGSRIFGNNVLFNMKKNIVTLEGNIKANLFIQNVKKKKD